MEFFGEYDVIVVGAGISGVVASVAAQQAGARCLLVEGSGILGGLLSGGRLNRPNGIVQPGVHKELLVRARNYGGADDAIQRWPWGTYSGLFDPEVMQRVIIETLEESGVDILLYSQVTDAVMEGRTLKGIVFQTKSGPGVAYARCLIDASGDGDLAARAGASFMLGAAEETMQPMTNYFRILNVDLVALMGDCQANKHDLTNVYPDDGLPRENGEYALKFFANGFSERISKARSDGFQWIVPRDSIVLKAGMLPGEINLNATRFHGNALDPRDRTRAAIELRKQAYCIHDFLRRYVDGFQNSVLYDIAPTLGVRETRRVIGDYVLTKEDVRTEARFDDAIGLSNCPIDIHQPDGRKLIMESVGNGYGIPFRCLLPKGVENLLVAGRCISSDPVAFSSTRNTPACALTAEAAGVAAAQAAKANIRPRDLEVRDIQESLHKRGVVLGTDPQQRIPGS
ncbi:FAD-dependent oxidoreductase [Cupriavidus sp. L7L]|uniref:FAD-dependent oxidoreductase n=1 Tax=Cupriavidus sp. L7L TaxID=2546443 RepID=UPI0010548448|nr:FAD-dependent oxidoreductase [Cupriavidus sp. L7L]TDF64933.1 FAD-dependent oxidoreductase [Cupriavidus sp. L7L]